MSYDPHKIYVPGTGNTTPRIAILGEGPSYEEIENLTPFVGQSGRLLNELLSQAGIKREDCWITNVSKYMVPPNPKTGKKKPFTIRAQSVGINIEQSLNELRYELHQLKPNVVIALGGTALWAMTGKEGIQKFRGSILHGFGGLKTVGTYHPAHILHQDGEVKGYWNKAVMALDLKRAYQQSHFPEVIRPIRNLNICQSSAQLYDFFSRYPSGRPALDIEARSCIPVCIGLAYTKSEGLTIPLWNIDGISNIPDSDLAAIWRMLAIRLASSEVIGQNFGYDRDKIRRLGFIIKRLYSDTMLKSFAIHPELPKNLAFNVSIRTEEPYYKDEGMYEGSFEDLFIGCARDSCVTKEVDDHMDNDMDQLGTRDFYERFLLPLHNVYHYRDDNTAIEQIGFRVNEERRTEVLDKYIRWDERLRYQLYTIAGRRINVNSWQQVSKLIYEEWKLPLRQGTGEESLTSLLNSPQVKNPLYRQGLEIILEDRRVRKTISTYGYALPDFDGRMRTSYFLCLDTGRSATQQQEAPIRPSESYKERNDDTGAMQTKWVSHGNAFQTMTKHGDIGPDVRVMYEADPGHVFLQADSSQAEARVIFLLAEDYDALRDIDEHDYHALTASWFVGGCEEDWSKRILGYEHPNRFLGKTLRHAGHLGASGRRAAIETNTQARKFKIDIKLSEAEAKKALDKFHSMQPKIKQVFQYGIIKALERNRRLTSPVPYGINAKVGGIRTFFERWGDELFRQAFSYIPQRTVSENTKGAALRIRGAEDYSIKGRAEWIKILVESHDALLAMVPIEREQEAALILKEELERPIDFSTCSLERGELIIPAEIERGFNYKDLSKFKWLM